MSAGSSDSKPMAPPADTAPTSGDKAPAKGTPSSKDDELSALDILEKLLDTRTLGLLALFALIALMQHPVVNRAAAELGGIFGTEPVKYNFDLGAETDVDLTLVTGDYRLLSCGSDEEWEGTHCAYHQDTKRRWPSAAEGMVDDNKKWIVQPYRTAAHNSFILVSGVWAQPEIADRLHREPPDVPEKEQTRFTAWCKVKIIGKPESIQVRWNPSQKWYEEKNATVARAESCTIEHPKEE